MATKNEQEIMELLKKVAIDGPGRSSFDDKKKFFDAVETAQFDANGDHTENSNIRRDYERGRAMLGVKDPDKEDQRWIESLIKKNLHYLMDEGMPLNILNDMDRRGDVMPEATTMEELFSESKDRIKKLAEASEKRGADEEILENIKNFTKEYEDEFEAGKDRKKTVKEMFKLAKEVEAYARKINKKYEEKKAQREHEDKETQRKPRYVEERERKEEEAKNLLKRMYHDYENLTEDVIKIMIKTIKSDKELLRRHASFDGGQGRPAPLTMDVKYFKEKVEEAIAKDKEHEEEANEVFSHFEKFDNLEGETKENLVKRCKEIQRENGNITGTRLMQYYKSGLKAEREHKAQNDKSSRNGRRM